MLRAAVIQLNTRNDKAANLVAIEAAVRDCVKRERPDWVQLPEHCEWLGGSGGAPAVAEPYRDGDTWTLLSRLSRESRFQRDRLQRQTHLTREHEISISSYALVGRPDA